MESLNISYNISKWQRKQKKCKKHSNAKKRNGRKLYNDKRSNRKSSKLLNEQYCKDALQNIKYNIDNYIDNTHNIEITSKCYTCQKPFILKDLPMTGNTSKPLICACCMLEHNYSINNYTIAFTADCIVCNKNYDYKNLLLIDKNCKMCKQSLSKYFNRAQPVICIHCDEKTDICTTLRKSNFCSSYKKLSHGFLWEIPITRTEITNEPNKWEFKSHFCGYKIWLNDTFCVEGLYSILGEKYKIVLRKDSRKCNVRNCTNLDNKRWCVYHKSCIICGYNSTSFEWMTDLFNKCENCGKAYCYEDNVYDDCGNSKNCTDCVFKQDKKQLMSLIKYIIDEKLIYDDIISVIYKYAYKYAFICANYKQCKNVITSESSILHWIERDYDWYFYNVKNKFNQNVINNCEYINFIKGTYIRAFCDECCEYMYSCDFCGEIEITEVCLNHPKYTCHECNDEFFCETTDNNLCKQCGQYSCGKCMNSKHNICEACKHPICEKDAIKGIWNEVKCKQCDTHISRHIAQRSDLSPTAQEFVPVPLSLPQLFQQILQMFQQNVRLFEQNWQLFPQHRQIMQRTWQWFEQDWQVFQQDWQDWQLFQQNWQLTRQPQQNVVYQQQLQIMPNYMMNNGNNHFGYQVNYTGNNYNNYYNQYL